MLATCPAIVLPPVCARRYVVTQMRHAVDVSDPVRLAKHLEVLIGTDGYEQLIGNQDEAMQQLGVQMDALDQEAAA